MLLVIKSFCTKIFLLAPEMVNVSMYPYQMGRGRPGNLALTKRASVALFYTLV